MRRSYKYQSPGRANTVRSRRPPVPAISGDDLLATVPEVAEFARIEVNNLSNVPSDYMDPPRWVELSKAVNAVLEQSAVAGVIVSHASQRFGESFGSLSVFRADPGLRRNRAIVQSFGRKTQVYG